MTKFRTPVYRTEYVAPKREKVEFETEAERELRADISKTMQHKLDAMMYTAMGLETPSRKPMKDVTPKPVLIGFDTGKEDS